MDEAPGTTTREDQIRAATIGEPWRADGPIFLAAYDPEWPALYEREAARIHSILGDRVRLLEHAGSTSVPGLSAKPVIDMVLAVSDSADERAYVPPLEAAGYVLRIREPKWFEHRLFKGPDTNINLHTFSEGCLEIDRMLAFRDRLRTHDDERSGTRRPSASWPLASGPTSSTTPTPRARSSKASSSEPWPIAMRHVLVDSERVTRYRPGTHMNTYLYFRCPA